MSSYTAAVPVTRESAARDAFAAVISYVLVVLALYLAFQVVTTRHVAGNFLLYAFVCMGALGVGFPLAYTVLVRRAPLADLGLTFRHLGPSLALGLLLGWDTYRHTLATLPFTLDRSLVPLIALALTVGLFEAVFFRGWLQLRLEALLGTVPGLVLAAALYSLYHLGYGMEPDQMVALFFYGLGFGAMFRLTRSVAVIWPAYTPVGGLYALMTDGVAMPFAATYGFMITLALMTAAVLLAARKADQVQREGASLS